jgi:uncharacterized protein YecT (DUF1311 family)
MKTAALCVLLALCFCGAASGAPHPLDGEIEKCMNDDPSTQGTIQCANMGKKKWDGELNRAYNELMKLLPKEGQALLRTAQRAWIPWRESEYKLLGGVYLTIYNNLDGGTMWLVANAIAEMDVVRERTLELIAYTEELKAGKPTFPGSYPKGQIEEQLAAAMKVKNDHSRLGRAFGSNGEVIAAEALQSWEDFRNKEAAFMAWFYGKTGDKAFPLHARMLKNTARIKKLEGLYDDLKAGGLREPRPERAQRNPEAERNPLPGTAACTALPRERAISGRISSTPTPREPTCGRAPTEK